MVLFVVEFFFEVVVVVVGDLFFTAFRFDVIEVLFVFVSYMLVKLVVEDVLK